MVQFHPGTAISHYRIVAALRRGDVGEVYTATDSRSGSEVHLEIIDQELLTDEQRVRKFIQESKAAARLHHVNLPRILDLGKASVDGRDAVFIATEPLSAETLRRKLDRRADLQELLPLLRDVADALATAHASGIVHRDLQPEAIVIAPQTKVTGFGRGSLTQPRMIWRGGFVEVGIPGVDRDASSVAYMAPELAEGNEVDFRADLFSFGVILYEAATGVSPFLSATPSETIENIVQNQPKAPREIVPDIPQQVDRVIRRCLAKRPDQRYASTAELVAALDAVIGGEPESVAPAPPRRRPLNLRVVGGIAAAAVLIFAALLAIPAMLDDEPKTVETTTSADSKETSIERLTETGDVVTAALSADGATLAYVRQREEGQSLIARDIQSHEEKELVAATPDPISSVTFSRDGKVIWYATFAGDLFHVSARGGTATRAMSGVHSPVTFSPRGDLLSFVRRAGPKSSLIVSDLGGKSSQTIAVRQFPDTLSTSGPAWSPTRSVIACAATVTKPTRRTIVLEVPVGRGASTVITDKLPNIGRLAWLPNGKSIIATTSGRFGRGGWIIDTTRGQVRRLVVDLDDFSDPAVPIGGRSFAAVERNVTTTIWRKDEDEIEGGEDGIVMLPDGSVVFAGSPEGRGLFWLGPNKEKSRRLTDTFAREPTASPNGRFIVFSGGAGRAWGLWRANSDGQNAKLLVSDRAGTPREPAVTPDGESVVYTLARPGKSPTLWRVAIDGGAPEPLTQVHAEMPAVSPDGRFVAARTIDETSGEAGLAIFTMSGGAVSRRFAVDPIALAWTSDGSISYTARDSGDVWKQPLSGSQPVKIHSFDEGSVPKFLFSADGTLAAALRSRAKSDVVLVRNFR